MTTTVQKQVLVNARALIADPEHWTSHALAYTADGQLVGWHNRAASKWCAVGAIYRAAYDLVGDQKEAIRIGNELANSICPRRWLPSALPRINDRRGHAAVLAVFDKALAAA